MWYKLFTKQTGGPLARSALVFRSCPTPNDTSPLTAGETWAIANWLPFSLLLQSDRHGKVGFARTLALRDGDPHAAVHVLAHPEQSLRSTAARKARRHSPLPGACWNIWTGPTFATAPAAHSVDGNDPLPTRSKWTVFAAAQPPRLRCAWFEVSFYACPVTRRLFPVRECGRQMVWRGSHNLDAIILLPRTN